MIGICKGCGAKLADPTKEYCHESCKPDYQEKMAKRRAEKAEAERAKRKSEFAEKAGIDLNSVQLTINVGRSGASESIKIMDAIEQLFDMTDLTHNEQKSVAEWVWMEYGRGQDQ